MGYPGLDKKNANDGCFKYKELAFVKKKEKALESFALLSVHLVDLSS